MNRFLVFSFPEFYPNGGMDDFIGDFDTLEEAKKALLNGEYSTGHVYDTTERKIIFEHQPNINGVDRN